MIGQVLVVPSSLCVLGDAMERAGLLSQHERATVHTSWGLNAPEETPIATS